MDRQHSPRYGLWAGASWPVRTVVVLSIISPLLLLFFYDPIHIFPSMWQTPWLRFGLVSSGVVQAAQTVDLSWYPPRQTELTNLSTALGGKGVYGVIFNSSETPKAAYGNYNWCNMPHIRREEYVKPEGDVELVYVEVVSLLCVLYRTRQHT